MSTEHPHNGLDVALPLESLSWRITKHSSIVSEYLRAQALPQPSFASDGPSTVVPREAPQYVRQAQQQLVSAALELSQLALGPSEFVPNLALGVRHRRFSSNPNREAC